MEIGKVSGNVLKRSVLGQITIKSKDMVKGAGIGTDCAFFPCADGEKLVSCMQEAAIYWAASSISSMKTEKTIHVTETMKIAPSIYGNVQGKQEPSIYGSKQGNVEPSIYGSKQENVEPYMTLPQLIQKCANNIAVSSAEPIALMLTLFLPEGTEEADIRSLMWEAEQKCRELSMPLAGGQTRITGQAASPLAVVTGYGRARANENHTAKTAAPGQEIVLSKWIGLQGTALLAKQNQEKLLERYTNYFVKEAAGFDRYLSVIPEAAAAVKSGVCAMHDASEGGIFAALWELAEGAGAGLNIDMRKLPLRQETVEVCECCNANPYELLSGGCLIMTTNDGQRLVENLAAEHIPAVLVGRITEGKGRILRNGNEIRYLDRPKQDQIYKIHSVTECKK